MLEAIFNVIFGFMLGIFNLLPNSTLTYDHYSWVNTLLQALAYFNSFIGNDMFLVVIGHSIFFWTAEVMWSIVEWIYKKIPGVD